jgi:hypothetical protein
MKLKAIITMIFALTALTALSSPAACVETKSK